MHDRRVSAAENRPRFDNSARKSDQFALLLAAGLNQRSGVEALPAALRQKSVPKFRGRVAEPAAAAERIHTLFTIHVGCPRSGEMTRPVATRIVKIGHGGRQGRARRGLTGGNLGAIRDWTVDAQEGRRVACVRATAPLRHAQRTIRASPARPLGPDISEASKPGGKPVSLTRSLFSAGAALAALATASALPASSAMAQDARSPTSCSSWATTSAGCSRASTIAA